MNLEDLQEKKARAIDIEIDIRTFEAMRGSYGRPTQQSIEEELSSSDEFWDSLEQLKIAFSVGDDVNAALVSFMDVIRKETDDVCADSVIGVRK